MSRWWIGATLIVISAVIVNGQEKSSKPATDKNQPTSIQQPSHPSTSVVFIGDDNSGNNTYSAEKDSKTYFQRLASPENLPNILLVFVAGITAWYVAKQAKETASATQAMRDSLPHQEKAANAALLNAKAVINAERAWIVIEVQWEGINKLHFVARNTGRTAAKITAIYGHPLVSQRNLTPEPDFAKRESLMSTPPCLLPPKATCSILTCNIEELKGGLEVDTFLSYVNKGIKLIWFYGRVIYFNTAEPEPRTEHDTKWFFWLPPVKDALPISDPRYPEWNQYT